MNGRVINSVDDLLRAAEDVASTLGDQVWWRGQGDSDWKLVPGVHRDPSRGPEYEHTAALLFVQRARTRHPQCPPTGELHSWLFFMQHYRLPTRLLDWTESVLFAGFFAV